MPEYRHQIRNFEDVLLWQQITTTLMKRYLDRLYNYRKREYLETRLELGTLQREDDNIPKEEYYTITLESKESYLEKNIKSLVEEILQSQSQSKSVKGVNA